MTSRLVVGFTNHEIQFQMIKSKIGSIKSGWRSVFMVFTTAAYDDEEFISDVAFENVEQGL